MKLISDIINDLVDEQRSLSVALNKTKILATRIGNKNLLNWVNNELKGYSDKTSLPAYRITQGSIIGDFINGRHHVTNYPIPLPELGDDMNKELHSFRLFDSISTLEVFTKNENPSLVFRFPDGVKRSLEDILKGPNGPYFQLLNIGVTVPLHFVNEALSAAKDKLLEFMLELEKEFGLETEIEDLKRNSSKINYIMATTINNHGDGNLINTGENAKIHSTININNGRREQLEETLLSNLVGQQDISELLSVIDLEEPSKSGFGTEVNSWFQKMIAKSLDGSWQISVGAAGTLLAEAIGKYYAK